MDDTEDMDARYPSKHQPTYNSSAQSRFASRNSSYPTNNNSYRDDDDENEYDDDGLDEEGNRDYKDQDEDEDDEEYDDQSGYQRERANHPNGDDSERRRKKRRLDNLVSNYEFAPRATPKPSFTAWNSPADWTDHATSVLLETWGDRFLQLGRKSLRSEDWVDVAEKVSEASKVERTETQCRTRLDTLKKKYKKEKTKMDEMGGGYSSKWVLFKKMDMLLNSSPRQQSGLACGIDSGEYVFMNPRVYLNRSNGLDEMRDSPGESESSENGDDSDGLPPKRKGFGGESGDDDDDGDGSSFRLLADSIQKFGEIYEKIESSKRQQMMELEKMRMDFQRDLEMQKKQILERAQAEIAKIQEGDDDDDDDDDDDTEDSAENLSG